MAKVVWQLQMEVEAVADVAALAVEVVEMEVEAEVLVVVHTETNDVILNGRGAGERTSARCSDTKECPEIKVVRGCECLEAPLRGPYRGAMPA